MTATIRTLRAVPLTAAAFAPFGEVIEIREDLDERRINYGHTTSYCDLADVDVQSLDGKPMVRIFHSTPVATPIHIRVMERHPLGSQLFMPLHTNPWLIVVARTGSFDPATLCAFHAGPHQGVNYRPGVWHHFLLALDQPGDFLVIDRKGPGDNLDEIDLAPADQVVIELAADAAWRHGLE